MPDRFPSSPGSVFPLYHVFADLAEWKSADLVRLRSTDPLRIEGLAVRAGTATHLLVANLTPQDQAVAIGPLEATRAWVRRLDEDTAPAAMTDPQRFRTTGAFEEVHHGALQVSLAPYAVVRIDAQRDV